MNVLHEISTKDDATFVLGDGPVRAALQSEHPLRRDDRPPVRFGDGDLFPATVLFELADLFHGGFDPFFFVFTGHGLIISKQVRVIGALAGSVDGYRAVECTEQGGKVDIGWQGCRKVS